MGDIAAHLGVSRQLVSLVLRDAPGASQETRARVREAAAALGYRPHLGARALRAPSSKHVGVAFTPAHATEPDIVESIYPAAERRGYGVVLSAQTPARGTEQALDELLGYRCEATIVIGSTVGHDALRELARHSPVPLVVVGAGHKNPSFDVVRSAGDAGIAQAVRHLVGLGHRDVVYVHCEAMPPAELRLQGYLDAAAEHGLSTNVIRMSGDYTEEAGSAAARQLLTGDRLPTAIVAGNDQAAFGVIVTLARAGIDVPAQVSVTGFDDSRLAALSSLALTTCRQDPVLMGEAAVEAAIRRIRRASARPSEFVIASSLVVRRSTAPPRPLSRDGRGRRRVDLGSR
jgi:DNA-binding LacI/PurR family transcriptional regulator